METNINSINNERTGRTGRTATVSVFIICTALSVPTQQLSYNQPIIDKTIQIEKSIDHNYSQGRISNYMNTPQFNVYQQYNTKFSEQEKVDILLNFASNLVNEQIDLDPDIAEMIEEHFWDMI